MAMRQAEDEDNVLDKSDLIDLEILQRTTRANGLISFEVFYTISLDTFRI